MDNQKSGILFAIGAYIMWGLFPFYWKMLGHVGSIEILMNRIIWSFVLTTIFILIIGQRKALVQDLQYLWKHKNHLVLLFIASIVVSMNWFLFIWAVQQDQILQASLAYYINPLLSVLCGLIFFKEKLSKALTCSVIIAAIGVLYMVITAGVVPWLALGMAVTFAIYGVLKKKIPLAAVRGLTLETLLLVPVAAIYYSYLFTSTDIAFLQIDLKTDILLVLSGVATAVPLIFFAKGAQKIPLYMMGFIQFLSPTITLFIGVYVYNEPFTNTHFITFSCIWIAIIIFSVSAYTEAVRHRRQLLTSKP